MGGCGRRVAVYKTSPDHIDPALRSLPILPSGLPRCQTENISQIFVLNVPSTITIKRNRPSSRNCLRSYATKSLLWLSITSTRKTPIL